MAGKKELSDTEENDDDHQVNKYRKSKSTTVGKGKGSKHAKNNFSEESEEEAEEKTSNPFAAFLSLSRQHVKTGKHSK